MISKLIKNKGVGTRTAIRNSIWCIWISHRFPPRLGKRNIFWPCVLWEVEAFLYCFVQQTSPKKDWLHLCASTKSLLNSRETTEKLSHGRRVRRWISCRGFLWETFKQLRYCPTQLSNKRGNLFSCSPFIWGGHTLKLDLEIRPDGWLVKHDGSNHTMYGTSNSGNSRRNAWCGALLTRMFNSVVYEATVFSTPSFEPVYARGRAVRGLTTLGFREQLTEPKVPERWLTVLTKYGQLPFLS